MANRRQKKKELTKAVKTITSFVEKFQKNMQESIKNNPYETKTKLLETAKGDYDNAWAWYYIVQCNKEIKRIS